MSRNDLFRFTRHGALGAFGAMLVCLLLAAVTHAADNAPAGGVAVGQPAIALEEVAREFDNPVFVTHAGDGSDRLFIVERPGRIRIVQNGELLETPFLDISDRVTNQNECGLLSMAFAPDYADSGEFYVYYSHDIDTLGNLVEPALPEEPDGGCDTVIARFTVTENANVAAADSQATLLEINQPYLNHNGGQIAFGPDGYLYIGMGDGGSGGDPWNLAQNPASLLGKILRIDVIGQTTYAVPPDNPFVGVGGYAPEIWALGVRNPWRFSFDRETGELFMGDVGQNRKEEINVQPAGQGGANYGWNIVEGDVCYPSGDACDRTGLTAPVYTYEHMAGGGFCNGSVTGGYVYRGATPSPLTGVYVFGDYCLNQIWGLTPTTASAAGATAADWTAALLLDVDFNVLSFGEDEAGNLYVAGANNVVYRIDGLPPGSYLPLIRR